MSVAFKNFEAKYPIEKNPMFVTNPIVKDGIKKYVTYSIMGSAFSSAVTRRFSDFYSLREKLVERWPGIYIPNIPPKKAVGNVDTKTIVYRMRLLNDFCLKISKLKYLFSSEEMKIFQTTSSDASKSLEKMPVLTSKAILDNYKAAFPDFKEEFDLILGKGKLLDFQSFMKKAILNLKNLKDIITETIAPTDLDNTNNATLIKLFEEYEREILLEYSEKDDNKMVFDNPRYKELFEKMEKIKTALNNPYQPFFEWIEEEEIDLEAMLQAMDTFYALNDKYDKTCQRADQIEVEIKNLQSGTKTVKGIFSFKSKDADLADLEKEKKETEENITNIHLILRICCFTMESQIEAFKTDKMKKYYEHLKLFADMHKENNTLLSELWDCVAQNKNLKDIISKGFS